MGTIQRSNEADTEELRSGVVVASGNAGRLVTTGGGRTAPQRLKTISQQEAKRQKQIQQARVDLLDQSLERQRRQDLSSGTIRNPADFTGEKSAPRSGSFGGSGQGQRSDAGFTGERVSGQPDWGEIAKGVVLQGADQAATGITSTLSMLEGAVMKPVGTLLGNDQLYESGLVSHPGRLHAGGGGRRTRSESPTGVQARRAGSGKSWGMLALLL